MNLFLRFPSLMKPAAYLPMVLPGVSVLGYWNYAAQVYSDAGTTLSTNAGTVQQWNDLSGNGRHISLTGGSVIYTSGASGYLAFDGTTSKMANAAFPLVAPLTVAAKLKLVNAGTNFQRVWQTVGSTNELTFARDLISNSGGHFRTASTSTYLDFTPATDNFITGFHGISIGYADPDGVLTADTLHDTASQQSASGLLNTTGFQLGDTFTAFQIQELVIYSGLLSAANTAALLAYFG